MIFNIVISMFNADLIESKYIWIKSLYLMHIKMIYMFTMVEGV